MTTDEVLQKISNLIDGPQVEPTQIIARNSEVLLASGNNLQAGDQLFLFRRADSISYIEEILPYKADAWLDLCGFGPSKLVALLDLENKLLKAQKTSAKMSTVRIWVDGVLALALQNPESRFDWAKPPYSFNEAIQEALAQLE
jgi:hypothetical protein